MTLSQELKSIIQRLRDPDSDERRWAVFDLESYPPEDVGDYVLKALQDESRGVREAAAELLGQYPGADWAEQVIPLLGSDRIEVRNLAATLLTQYGGAATEGLVHALESSDENIRKFAADILGLNGDPAAVPALCRIAEGDPVDNVVTSTVEALGKIGSKDALPTLNRLFVQRSEYVAEIAEAIGLIGATESASFLEAHLNWENPVAAFGVVDALGNIGYVKSIAALQNFFDQTEGELRHQTAKAILKIGRKAGLNILSKERGLFWESITQLLLEGDEEIDDLLVFQLQLDQTKEVITMVWQLVKIAPSSLLLALIAVVGSKPEYFKLLCHLCYHSDEEVAFNAIRSLGHFEREMIVPVLRKLFEAHPGYPLLAALKIVEEKQLKELLPVIKELRDCDDLDVQTAAEEITEYLQSI